MTLRTPDFPLLLARPRRLLGLLLSALVAALPGCSALPPSGAALPETPVPAQWSTVTVPPADPTAPAATASLAAWWQRFNDPQLTALVGQALRVNTEVRGAQAALQQSRALRDVKSAGLGPVIGGSASARRSQTGDNDPANSFQAGFDASWEPDVFGGRRSALNATEADARAAEASLANVQVSIAAEVAVTYIELRGLQARLAIARDNLAAQSETLQLARWRAQAGLASSLDVEQAVAASEQTSAQIPSLQTSAAQALSSLAVLTGQAPGALQATLTEAAAVPRAPGGLALAIPAETLRQRPDVRAAEHRISAALARALQADAARYPGFQISGSLGLSALTLGSLTSGASVVNTLLASVSLPLFDGGAARAQVRAQEAALEQARVSYQASVLTALKDVEDALVALGGDRERLVRLQAAAAAAANADLLARQRYASGLIDFRTVLDTQRTLLATQDSVASTRASLSADHVRLYKALGGGWAPGTETAAP
ncbi:MAG: efflux transporter outer membrane subunit [Polaromonas sp.]